MKRLILVIVFAICAAIVIFHQITYRPVMADCKDGTVSYSKHRSGTCSRHGGVAKWR